MKSIGPLVPEILTLEMNGWRPSWKMAPYSCQTWRNVLGPWTEI